MTASFSKLIAAIAGIHKKDQTAKRRGIFAILQGTGQADDESHFIGLYAIFRTFNNATNNWGCSVSGSYSDGNETSQWVKVDFGAGNKVAVQAYSVGGAAGYPGLAPTSFYLEASDDNVTWSAVEGAQVENGSTLPARSIDPVRPPGGGAGWGIKY